MIRILVLLLAITAVVLTVAPILVLVDLVSGGTGFGLCPGGIEICDRPYTTGPEIIILLTIALFGILAAIRVLMRMARRLQGPANLPAPLDRSHLN